MATWADLHHARWSPSVPGLGFASTALVVRIDACWRDGVDRARDNGLVDPSYQRRAVGIRLGALVAGHIVMLVLMFVLLETYEPEPNGFRFDTAAKLGSFAVMTLAPIVIGLIARRVAAAAAVSLLQTLSPLLLLANNRRLVALGPFGNAPSIMGGPDFDQGAAAMKVATT